MTNTWTSAEDGRRYRGLTKVLAEILGPGSPRRAEQRVSPEDLALYLEWITLAREESASLKPFLMRSSPYALSCLSYADLARDFQSLARQLGGSPADRVH